MMLTAETITNSEIRDLWIRGEIDVYTHDMATRHYPGSNPEWRTQARARCAEILNARQAVSK